VIRSTSLELVSRISPDGRLSLSLSDRPLVRPGPGEVLVEVRAAPINPSDLLLLLGPVDVATLKYTGVSGNPVVEGVVPASALGAVKARLGKAITVGNEGAGVVVDAGPGAGHLLGRTVAFRSSEGSYATHRTIRSGDCLEVPEGVSPEMAASAFINPLTTLCMLETLKREGHRALVHTAAASNLGQMLNRLCIEEGIPLVSIVRSEDQVALLREQGATHVLDSTVPDFPHALRDAIRETGATLAFDAIGGGSMASTILAAMEQVERDKLTEYSRYGAPTHKQVYIYGLLDPGPRIIQTDVGTAWGVGGWLMSWELAKLDPQVVMSLKTRVATGLQTTFASRYAGGFDLGEVLTLAAIGRVTQRATNQKYLVYPNGQGA
jgi:NADPH:quinone reductase-like Zn-dependent oxidoreductase